MTVKHQRLIAAVAAWFFLALDGWSAQQEITHYEKTQRRIHATTASNQYM